VRITDLCEENEATVHDVAALLLEGFHDLGSGWPDVEAAFREVSETLKPGRISRVALAEDGTVVGQTAAASRYDGNVWELHPLVVRPQYQGKGIGRALVDDLETLVRVGLSPYE
jgi:aminoglycoside 6'-N-acetyltransferase I